MTRLPPILAASVALLAGIVALPLAAQVAASTPTSAAADDAASPSPVPMDQRKPVPLLVMMANHQKQNMRDHLEAVQEIVAAIAMDDYAAVEKSAGRIGYSEQMGQMCAHMGAAAPGFAEQAIAFHLTADRIAEAARARDRSRVLVELGATLQTCTSCHAEWKQEIVDEPTWRRLTSSAAAGPAESQ
jgi:cytochrome c556